MLDTPIDEPPHNPAGKPIVDAFPFPSGKPVAQELVRIMAGLYRSQREAITATAEFGIDEYELTPGLSPINLWWEILTKLAIQGTVRQTVTAALKQFPNNRRSPFLAALLADRDPAASAEPVSENGPSFDDSITKQEALLFFDDLTIPVGKIPNLIAILNKMTEYADAVCLLRVESELGRFFGTAFRFRPDLVLTNHHVLYPRGKIATVVCADFGFDVDANGAMQQVTSLPAKVKTIDGEKKYDWAVIEVPGMSHDWPILPLSGSPAPKAGDLAYILQHPNAQHKRLGYVRNMISEVDDDVVRYLTDTEPGSSGSPVFDAKGSVIALHHAGGRPIEVAGKPPVAKNEGVRVDRICERMKAKGII
jgi:V8-like Glu-specific endopeptidase